MMALNIHFAPGLLRITWRLLLCLRNFYPPASASPVFVLFPLSLFSRSPSSSGAVGASRVQAVTRSLLRRWIWDKTPAKFQFDEALLCEAAATFENGGFSSADGDNLASRTRRAKEFVKSYPPAFWSIAYLWRYVLPPVESIKSRKIKGAR